MEKKMESTVVVEKKMETCACSGAGTLTDYCRQAAVFSNLLSSRSDVPPSLVTIVNASLSKLLVSPLITTIVVPYIIPYITPLKEFRL